MWKKVLLNRNRHSKTDPGSYSSVKCGKYSAAWGCAVIFMDTRVWSLPCPRFIHGFFRSKASANRNRSVRMLALPLVKKRREPKSFLSRAKAPSTWMERHRRRWTPRSEVRRCVVSSRFSQKVFCRHSCFGCSGSLARQHWLRQGQPVQFSQRYQAVETNWPSFTSVHAWRKPILTKSKMDPKLFSPLFPALDSTFQSATAGQRGGTGCGAGRLGLRCGPACIDDQCIFLWL